MEKNTASDAPVPLLGEDWFDPLEAGVRQHIRSFIEAMLESELEAALNRGRYERTGPSQGHRHGHRDRQILGTFGPTTVSVPRARLGEADGTTRGHDPGARPGGTTRGHDPGARPGNGGTGRCPPTSG